MSPSIDLAVFLGAAIVLAITPGPGIAYVLARTIRGGRSEGFESVLGTAIGGMVHVVIAAVGLSALIAASPFWFTLIKYLGAIYLVYLGVRIIIGARGGIAPIEPTSEFTQSRVIVEGILVEATNVKTALFFLAFIPQFVDPAANVATQFLLLGTCVVVLNSLVDIGIVMFAGWLAPRVQANPRIAMSGVMSGLVMIGLGLFLGFSETRSPELQRN